MSMPTSARRRFLCLGIVIFIVLLLGASTQHEKIRQHFQSFAKAPPALVIDGEEIPEEILPPGANGWTPGALKGPGPDYKRFILAEQALPQHDLDAPFPGGRTGRYVKFSNQLRGLGWNNVLTDVLLTAHAAWRANRTYVFRDYEWSPVHYPWRIPNWPWPRSPLSTLISGPIVGGPWDAGDGTPRSVREDFWDIVCPKEETEFIDIYPIKKPINDSDGVANMNRWVQFLQDSPSRCVDIVGSVSVHDDWPQIFDLWLIGTTRLLSLWDEFKASPITRLLGVSPLVQSAIDRNEYLFFPKGSRPAFAWDPYARMMAAHIRHGDYVQACEYLANHNSTFYGWNNLPQLPDPFTPPPNLFEIDHAPPEHIKLYLHRCLPTNDEILDKIMDSKRAWENNGTNRHLSVLFLMTNANQAWVDDFTASLEKANVGWDIFVTSKDFKLDFEQTGVNMAIDMEIARKAAVYIGNGWSSMTSNIIHRRMADEKEPLSNRFW